MIALEIVHYLLLIYIGASVFFLINYAILGHFIKIKTYKNKQNKFVVFIPLIRKIMLFMMLLKRF
jgi:hypothetical protein